MLTARRQFGDASMGSPAGQRTRPRGARGRKAAELTPEIISPEEILEIQVLWPAKCESTGGVETWTFVQM
jgi:hypothetical protein